jgi:hypothetical protein
MHNSNRVIFDLLLLVIWFYITLSKKSFSEFLYVAINASGGVIIPLLSFLIPAFEILINKKLSY